MSEYTKPELSDFRDSWACEHVRAEVPLEDRRAEFDRMLAEVVREASEKAWDEGEQSGYEDALGEQRGIGQMESARNPFRSEAHDA